MSLFERIYLLFVPVRDKTIQPYLKDQSPPNVTHPNTSSSERTTVDSRTNLPNTAPEDRAKKFGYTKDL
jgi:hypothetical protein